MSERREQTAAIVVIGDEILSGKYSDENAVWLIKELRELGVALRRIEVIPDALDDIAATVRATSARVDHVFTSGGVGPTHDDLTIEGIARAFDTRVVRHPDLEKLLRAFYGTALEERNLRMADVPEGAVLVPPDAASDHPTWPVVSYRNIYILPGVPVIFRRKFTSIRERFRATPFHLRRVYCMADEGALAVHLDAVVAAHPMVAVGSYPRFEAQDYRVVITIECKDPTCADRARDDLIGRLGTIVVRTD